MGKRERDTQSSKKKKKLKKPNKTVDRKYIRQRAREIKFFELLSMTFKLMNGVDMSLT